MAFYTLCFMSLECGSNVVRCVDRWNLITYTKIKKPSHYGGQTVEILNRVFMQIPFLFHHINMVIINSKVSNEFSETTDFILVYRRNKQKSPLQCSPEAHSTSTPPAQNKTKKEKKKKTFDSLNFWKKKNKVKTPPLASNLDSFVGINVHWSASEHTTPKLTWISSSHRYIISSGNLPIPT